MKIRAIIITAFVVSDKKNKMFAAAGFESFNNG